MQMSLMEMLISCLTNQMSLMEMLISCLTNPSILCSNNMIRVGWLNLVCLYGIMELGGMMKSCSSNQLFFECVCVCVCVCVYIYIYIYIYPLHWYNEMNPAGSLRTNRLCLVRQWSRETDCCTFFVQFHPPMLLPKLNPSHPPTIEFTQHKDKRKD